MTLPAEPEPAAQPGSGAEPELAEGREPAEPEPAGGPARTGPVYGAATIRGRGHAWDGRRGFPWFGVALIAVGAAALVAVFDRRLSGDSLVLLALGLVGLAALLVGRVRWIALPSALLVPWGLARVLHELDLLRGPGWPWVFVGAGFLALYLYGLVTSEGHGWAIWLAALLLGVGAVEVASGLPGLQRLRGAWLPVLLVGMGVALVARALLRPRGGVRWGPPPG